MYFRYIYNPSPEYSLCRWQWLCGSVVSVLATVTDVLSALLSDVIIISSYLKEQTLHHHIESLSIRKQIYKIFMFYTIL